MIRGPSILYLPQITSVTYKYHGHYCIRLSGSIPAFPFFFFFDQQSFSASPQLLFPLFSLPFPITTFTLQYSYSLSKNSYLIYVPIIPIKIMLKLKTNHFKCLEVSFSHFNAFYDPDDTASCFSVLTVWYIQLILNIFRRTNYSGLWYLFLVISKKLLEHRDWKYKKMHRIDL